VCALCVCAEEGAGGVLFIQDILFLL
jgi:hypothetical protein